MKDWTTIFVCFSSRALFMVYWAIKDNHTISTISIVTIFFSLLSSLLLLLVHKKSILSGDKYHTAYRFGQFCHLLFKIAGDTGVRNRETVKL